MHYVTYSNINVSKFNFTKSKIKLTMKTNYTAPPVTLYQPVVRTAGNEAPDDAWAGSTTLDLSLDWA